MSSKTTVISDDHEEDAAGATATGVGTVPAAIQNVSKAQLDGGANSSPASLTIAPPRRKSALVGYWEERAKAQQQNETPTTLRESRATGAALAKQRYSINNTNDDGKEKKVVVFPPLPPENAIFRGAATPGTSSAKQIYSINNTDDDGKDTKVVVALPPLPNEYASRDEVDEVKDEAKEIIHTAGSIQVKDSTDQQGPKVDDEEDDDISVKEVEVAPSKGYATKHSPVLASTKNETVADVFTDSVKHYSETAGPNVFDLHVAVEAQRDDNPAIDAITTDQLTCGWRKRKGILYPLMILIVIVIAAIAALFVGRNQNPRSSSPEETSPSLMPSVPPIQQCSERVSLAVKGFGLNHSDTMPPTLAIDGKNAVSVTESGQVFFYTLLEGDWVQNTEFVAEHSVNDKAVPAVALSGNYAVVGFMYYKSANGTEMGGGAQVYKLNEATDSWEKDALLVPSDKVFNSNSNFGWSVAIDAHQLSPLVAVGAYLDNERTGAVYVFELSNSTWSEVTKLVPDVCQKEALGYTVAVSGDYIVSSTDCAFNVLAYKYDRVSKRVDEQQRIRYINSNFGPIDALVMNKNTLVYTTIFGGVVIYERTSDVQDFSYLQQIDFTNYTESFSFPLSIDKDIFVVVVGNKQHVFMSENGKWAELLTIKTNATLVQSDASEEYRRSVAVGGRNILASNSNDVYHYNIEECANPMPTQSPSVSKPSIDVTPGLSITNKPSVIPPTTPNQAENVTCYELEVTVDFDANPLGTGWTLVEVRSDGTRAFVGSLYPSDDSLANQSQSESFCLPLQSTFEFTFYDSYSDGICCSNGQGSYILTHSGEIVVEGGEFTDAQFSQQHTFST
jgi:hypothetical protein